jgi:hypothetical protein
MCDMRFLIKYIEGKLLEQNMGFLPHEPITQRKVNSLFASINDEFLVNPRDVQKSWLSAVRRLRDITRLNNMNNNNNGNDDNDEIDDIDDYDTDDEIE